MLDLRKVPFNLSDEEVQWVLDTISDMTLEEKIGQLFFHFIDSELDDQGKTFLKHMLDDYHIGGIRYTNKNPDQIWDQNQFMQENSKLPLLIASNCDNGGDGACKEGTYVATAAACGATAGEETAYHVGLVSGREAAAVGCNWSFNPVSDIYFNWQNTIVNTRSYGNTAETVIRNAKAYVKGLRESGLAACVKHFPGDGVEARDQHLLLGVNDFSCEEWDRTYGNVYRELIKEGVQTIMVGHIALPEYSKKLVPGMQNEDILPATLSKELLQDLLRNQLGFQGLLITDASHMGGLITAMPRSEFVPKTIAAGCDMFLFFRNPEEDFNYMLQGYRDGIITEERLQEALMRILGLKASLKLPQKKHRGKLISPREGLAVVGCKEHQKYAREAAKKSITLVKDTQKLLPVDPRQKKRAKVFLISASPTSIHYKEDAAKPLIEKTLIQAGFTVDMNDSFYDMERKYGYQPENEAMIQKLCSIEEFKKQYDIVFVFVNMKGYAQENNVRLRWSYNHTNELPWYVTEVPTVCISLNYTNHLYDLPMMKTFINAYAPTETVIEETVKKIIGESSFEGKANDTVFCGRWDARR